MNFNYNIDKEKYTSIDDYPVLVKEDKCDFVGFRPLSVRIKEMKAKGELTELFSALENSNIEPSAFFNDNSDVSNMPVSVLNVKGLDKVETINAIKLRYNNYLSKLQSYKDSLLKYTSPVVAGSSETPHTSSEPAADGKDSK